MDEHTKPPIIQDTRWHARHMGSEGWAVFAGHRMLASHLSEEHAHLIAAAPRTLEALEGCLSLAQTMATERPNAPWLNENGWMSSTALCGNVIFAIRKAKGA